MYFFRFAIDDLVDDLLVDDWALIDDHAVTADLTEHSLINRTGIIRYLDVSILEQVLKHLMKLMLKVLYRVIQNLVRKIVLDVANLFYEEIKT